MSEVTEKPVYQTYEDFPPEDLFLYAGLDCIATSGLLSNIFPALVDSPVHLITENGNPKTKMYAIPIVDTYKDITRMAMEYILDMEMNGIPYDVAENRRVSLRLQTEIEALEEEIFQVVPRGLNLDSGKVMAEFLYITMGLEVPYTTTSGEPSTDGAALLTLAGLDPLRPPSDYRTPDPAKQYLATLAKRKDLNSIHNSFVKTYVEDFVKRDGCIHPSYNLHGTSGFRISGDSPNLLQLPRPKHGYNLRELYTVRDGYVFIAFDFSSAEVKILGALSKDKNILKAIAEGLDFHSFSACSMLGTPYNEYMDILGDKAHPLQSQYKSMRQTAKVLLKIAPTLSNKSKQTY